MRQMPSSSSAVNRAPVGLFGLQIRISFVVARHQRVERREVRTPPARCLAAGERPRVHARAERPRDPAHLHVVRHHHHDVVAALDEVPEHDAVGLGTAVGDLDVLGSGSRIHRRDRAPQIRRPVRLRVAQFLREQGRAVLRRVGELLQPERMDAAFRQVPGHPVLPGRLQPFHRKRFQPHEPEVYPKPSDPPAGTPCAPATNFALSCEPRCMAADLLPELALIPSGEFLMGSDDADDDERPAHRVHLDDFLMPCTPSRTPNTPGSCARRATARRPSTSCRWS